MSGVPAKEDTIPGTVEVSLLEDDLDPESELEVDIDADVDEDVVDEVDVDADTDVDTGDETEVSVTVEYIEFELGDNVVYPHHGAGQVQAKEVKEVFGERREYLTIKILHNDMTVMVPTENAALAGLRRVIDEETVKKVLAVLQDECSEMPKNWNRRFKHNRDKIKTGDIYELAEVVRNLAIREAQKGLSTGEKQMFTRAKKILASELMYALEMDEDEVDEHLYSLLLESNDHGKVAVAAK
jgi:CarD family transcriptional regulator, regulator of rRNA transcription